MPSWDNSQLQNAQAAVAQAVATNLGESDTLQNGTFRGWRGQTVWGFRFPDIPEGVPTTIVQVPLPITTAPPSQDRILIEEGEVLAVFCVAGLLWALPWFCANLRGCCGCRCLQKFIARRLSAYFCIGLLANLVFISIVIAHVPHITANDLFFALVGLIEVFADKLQEVLIQVSMLVALVMVYTFRSKLIQLLGFDQQLVRADLRDILTCFTMNRFRNIEVSIWKVSGLPTGFGTRTLFMRALLGYNEPRHSRPHDNCTTFINLRERFNLNYDPVDNTQKLSIVIKQQEVVGAAVAQLAPAAGALVGGAVGIVTPIGPAPGAGLGAVTGVGCANSLGPEIARVDLSSAMINRIRSSSEKHRARAATDTGPAVPWSEDFFMKVDLVPQGECWLRVTDVS